MKTTTVISKERSEAINYVSTELSKVGITAIGISSALIGCWAVACLASGLINSGGPVALMSNLYSALVG